MPYWIGGAPAVAQVDTASIDSVDGTPSNNTFTVTVGGLSIDAVGDTDVATTAAALVASLNASTDPRMSNITWTNPSAGSIVATAVTAGVAFVSALTETGAGTGAVTDFAATTANEGPNVFNTAANWDTSTAPVNDDEVIFADNAISCVWGLDTSLTGITLYIDQTYTGKLGLDRRVFATSADGATTVSTTPEYRQTALQLDAARIEIGRALSGSIGSGSTRIKVDNTRSSASTNIVHRTGSSSGNVPAVHISTANASGTIEVREGSGGVGIGVDVPGSTYTIGTLDLSGQSASTTVAVGPGVTLTTFRQTEGVCYLRAAANVTTVTQTAGTLTLEGDGWDVVTANLDGGTCFLNGQVDITTANLAGGTLDGSGSAQARTVGTLVLSSGSVVLDAQLTITTLSGISLSTGTLSRS